MIGCIQCSEKLWNCNEWTGGGQDQNMHKDEFNVPTERIFNSLLMEIQRDATILDIQHLLMRQVLHMQRDMIFESISIINIFHVQVIWRKIN